MLNGFSKVIVILALFSVGGYSNVFINTVPMKADVYLDGEFKGKTPILIKENIKGKKKVFFKKAGYYDVEIAVDLKGGMTNIYSLLTPSMISIAFPDSEKVVFNSKEYSSDYVKNMSEGIYHFKSGENSVSLLRLNPNQGYMWTGIAATAVGLLGFTVSHILSEQAYTDFTNASDPYTATSKKNLTLFYDNLKMVSLGVGVIGAGVGVWFFIDDINFNKENSEIRLKDKNPLPADEELYNNGMDFLSQLSNQSALSNFNVLIDNYPESKFFPISLMRRAKIFKDMKRLEDSYRDLSRLKTEYPIFELYEATLYELGDIGRDLKKYSEAYENFEGMLSFTNIFTDYEIYYEMIETKVAEYKQTKNKETKTLVDKLVKDFIFNAAFPADYKEMVQGLKY